MAMPKNFDSFFTLLNMDYRENWTIVSLKKAYRKASMTHHPDKDGDSEDFKVLNGLYTLLSPFLERRPDENQIIEMHEILQETSVPVQQQIVNRIQAIFPANKNLVKESLQPGAAFPPVPPKYDMPGEERIFNFDLLFEEITIEENERLTHALFKGKEPIFFENLTTHYRDKHSRSQFTDYLYNPLLYFFDEKQGIEYWSGALDFQIQRNVTYLLLGLKATTGTLTSGLKGRLLFAIAETNLDKFDLLPLEKKDQAIIYNKLRGKRGPSLFGNVKRGDFCNRFLFDRLREEAHRDGFFNNIDRLKKMSYCTFAAPFHTLYDAAPSALRLLVAGAILSTSLYLGLLNFLILWSLACCLNYAFRQGISHAFTLDQHEADYWGKHSLQEFYDLGLPSIAFNTLWPFLATLTDSVSLITRSVATLMSVISDNYSPSEEVEQGILAAGPGI